MTPEELARLRRARDLMDREYAKPLDAPAMARAALMSAPHFSRQARAAYGETPYSYLISRSLGLPSSGDGPDLVHYLRSARRARIGTGIGDS